jgi:hypothetical protein
VEDFQLGQADRPDAEIVGKAWKRCGTMSLFHVW